MKVIDGRKIFVIANLIEGSWFGDFNIFFNLTSQYQYVASASLPGNESSEEIDQVRCLLCPAARLLSLCEEYPKVARFLYKRALIRRNYFRLIETTYNMTYKVQLGYDFLQAACRKQETRDYIKHFW